MLRRRARSPHLNTTAMSRRRARSPVSAPLQCQDVELEARVSDAKLETHIQHHINKETQSLRLAFQHCISAQTQSSRVKSRSRGTETLLRRIYAGQKYPHIYTLSISKGKNQSMEARGSLYILIYEYNYKVITRCDTILQQYYINDKRKCKNTERVQV